MVIVTKQWQGFTQHPKAQAIVEGLSDIPNNWALTPVSQKSPYRDGWQKETPLTKDQIKNCILNGEQLWSKEKEKYYRVYASGYGVRLGDMSDGLLAIDVDGESAQRLLNAIAPDKGIPETVTWTSGKSGRYQMVFQVPEKYREWLKDFTKREIKELNGVKCESKEQLELRYNTMQSVLPFSYHPETGQYEWLISPNEVEVATAPEWLLELAIVQRETEDLHQAAKEDNSHHKLINQAYEQDTRELAEKALQYIPPRNPGGGNYYECLRVLMALESEFGDEAIALAESWSPSIPGTTWNVPYKVKSIQKTAKTGITIGTLFHIAKQYGFEMPKPTGKGVSSRDWGTRLPKASGFATSDYPQQQQPIDIKAEINHLADSSLTKSEVNLKLNELSQQTGFIPSELRRMYEARLEETEKESAIADNKQELEKLFKLESAQINLSDHIDNSLAKPLSQIAEILGTREEAFLTTLLPTVASLTAVGTRLELIKATDFYALPILYTGIVGESGTAKSPTQKTILNPLFKLQNEYEQQYQQEYEQWLEECKQAKENDEPDPPEPKLKELWTDDSTSEAIALIQSNQPDDGFLNWRDELSGLVKDNNKYRGGKGSDAEKVLSGRDGSPIKVNRASGKRINCKQSAYSITGGTQPDTLRKQIDFDDPTGHWARFLWCLLPLKQNTFPRNAPDIDISEYLLSIYKQIKAIPATTYQLSPEALDLYADWYDLLEKRKYSETRQGLRAVYSKSKNDTGIIALLLHILNSAIAGETPGYQISSETMQSAITISNFYISQVRLIHSEGDAEEGSELAAIYKKILDLSQRKQNYITARDVVQSGRQFRKMKPDDIRCLFREMADMGMAVLSGLGTRLKLISKTVVGVVNCCQSVVSTDNRSKTTNNQGSMDNESSVVDDVDISVGGNNNSDQSKSVVVDESKKDGDNSDNSLTKTPANSKTEPVVSPRATDNTSTTDEEKPTTDKSETPSQSVTTDNNNPTTVGDNSYRAPKKHQWVTPNANPWGTENDLPIEDVEQLVRDYLSEHGESEEIIIVTNVGQKTPRVKAALNKLAVVTRRTQWECYWNLPNNDQATNTKEG